jgi:hypothetical protein
MTSQRDDQQSAPSPQHAAPSTHARHAIAAKRIVDTTTATAAIEVRRELRYDDTSETHAFDLYLPAPSAAACPVVLFVTGYGDAGAQRMLGCRFKDMGAFVSWAELVAAAGLAAVCYATDTPADVGRLIAHLERTSSDLQIDPTRMGLWACSGHAPMALTLVMDRPHRFRCAALLYPYTFDLPESDLVATAARQFGFTPVAAGRQPAELPAHVPLFVVRAGRDEMPGLNLALDRFAAAALGDNLPITIANHPAGPHAFDLVDDSIASRRLIRQTIAFLVDHLGPL